MIPLTYSPLIASLGWRQFSWKGRASHWNWNYTNVYIFVTFSLIAFFCFAIRYLVPLYLWFLCHQGILLIQLYLNLLGDLQCTWNQYFEQVLSVCWWLKSCENLCTVFPHTVSSLECFPPLNSYFTSVRKLFRFLLHKGKMNEETIWNFQGLKITKNNSCRGNYMRKYGIRSIDSYIPWFE